MKKPTIPILGVLTALFAVFLLGLSAGRRLDPSPVLIRPLPTVAATQPAPAETEPPYPVNINTASAEKLQTLPDIGPVLSQRIIDYRESSDGFQTKGELAMVSGIGEKTLEQLWDLITVE